MDLKKTYDIFQYKSLPFAASNPEHLEAVGILLGLSPRSHEDCRVLEIGCSSGGNLIPLAIKNPRSTYIGIDLSDAQIALAQKYKDTCGIDNVKFYACDISKFDFSKEEPFDYIICHGVFSWVPPQIQSSILGICSSQLTKSGMAYISYNVMPGWAQLSAIRDMVLTHTANIPSHKIQDKVTESINFISFLSEKSVDPVFKSFLQDFSKNFKLHQPYYIAHEYLEYYNQPFYFKDFIKATKEFGLEYVADSDISTIYFLDIEKETRRLLVEQKIPRVNLEQYADFVRNRKFRRSILTMDPAAQNINLQDINKNIKNLNFGLFNTFSINKEDVINDYELKITNKNGVSISTKDPRHKAILYALKENNYSSKTYDELTSRAKIILGKEDSLDNFILDMFLSWNALSVSTKKTNFNIDDVNRKFLTHPYYKMLLKSDGHVVDRYHRCMKFEKNKLDNIIINLMDGNNSIKDIAQKIEYLHQKGIIKINSMELDMFENMALSTANLLLFLGIIS